MNPPTLHEDLAAIGWTSTPGSNAIGQGRNVYDEDGTLIGQLTASETWDLLRTRRHEAGDLCTVDGCDDCDDHRRAVARLDARERYLDGAGDYAYDSMREIGGES